MSGRPNSYDWRTMRQTVSALKAALRQAEWMLEPDRSLVDREMRAMMVARNAAWASLLADRIEARFATEREGEGG